MLKVTVRPMYTSDMPIVLAIEHGTFRDPWNADVFRTHLMAPTLFTLVAEATHSRGGTVVVGYVVCEVHRQSLRLLNLAVYSAVRRMGVATQLIDRLKTKLVNQRRDVIEMLLSDCNLDGHLFAKAVGFRATEVLHDSYGEEQDGYLFRYDVQWGEQQRQPVTSEQGEYR